MKKIIKMVLMIVIAISLSVLGFIFTPSLEANQIETLKILGIVAACSAGYCFIVGELSRNNSQMDKIWSIIPIAYAWIVVVKGNFNPRLIIIATLITFWGVRLTINFAKKGAYTIKFWAGEEDYRWKFLRGKKPFDNKLVWGIFDLLFISIYQNFIVLSMCLPMVAVMNATNTLNVFDYLVALLVLIFFSIELVADKEQMYFQNYKWGQINSGKKLEELEEPFNLGFNTIGLWNLSRHPNYLGEQGFWASIYLFVITSNCTSYGIFNWSIYGFLFLMLIFVGSSVLSENITASKYPLYKDYIAKTGKYIGFRKYRK